MGTLRETEAALLLEGLAVYKLFVGSLPPDVTENQIVEVAGRFCDPGQIVEAHIMSGKGRFSRSGRIV